MALRLSASLGELDKLACCISVSDTTLANYMGTLPSSVVTLHSQLALARQQILLLESENAFFREEVDKLQRNASVLIAEISVLQFTLDYVKQSKILRLPLPDKEKAFQLEKRLADYEKIIHTLAEGLSLDPNILEPTHSCIPHGRESEGALVEAIQNAARNKNSPWSRVLPTLTKSAQEKHIAAINLILDTRKDLHNMEKLAHFWKARAALSRPIALYRHMASLPSRSPAEAPSTGLFPARPPLLVPVPSRHLKESVPRGITSSSRPLRCSHSDGVNSSANRSIRKVRTGYVRRAASHDFKPLDIQVPEKRHGFIMPCIKSDPNEHSSTPANTRFGLNEFRNVGAGPVAPFTTMPPYGPNSASCRVSLRTARIFQSAERLCATFSSGSLGSLEASTLSEPNTETVLDTFPNDFVGATTSVKLRDLAHPDRNPNSGSDHTKSIDSTGCIDDRDFTFSGGKTVQGRGSENFSVPSPTSTKLAGNHTISSPPGRATTSWGSHQLTSQPTARTVRLCRSEVSAYQPKTGQSFSNQSEASPPSLRLHIPSFSNLTRGPQQTPGSGFTLKSALAKPSTVTSEIPQRPPLLTPNNEAQRHPPSSSKPRSRLRVVNNSTRGDLISNEAPASKLSARQRHPRPDSTTPDKNLPKSPDVRDAHLHSRLISRGRSERDKLIGSISGMTGVTGKDLSHRPSAKAKTAMVEGQRTKRT